MYRQQWEFSFGFVVLFFFLQFKNSQTVFNFLIKYFQVLNWYGNHVSSWNEFLERGLSWNCWCDVSHPNVNSVTIISAWTNNEIEHLVKWGYFSYHKLQLHKTWVCKCEGKASSIARQGSSSGKNRHACTPSIQVWARDKRSFPVI